MTRKHETIDAYIGDCAGAVVPLLNELRAFVHATMPGASEAMQFGAPVFLNAHGVPVVYLYGSKRHVNFGFLRSGALSDPNAVLKGSGKPSKHIRLVPERPLDKALLAEFLNQCADIRP